MSTPTLDELHARLYRFLRSHLDFEAALPEWEHVPEGYTSEEIDQALAKLLEDETERDLKALYVCHRKQRHEPLGNPKIVAWMYPTALGRHLSFYRHRQPFSHDVSVAGEWFCRPLFDHADQAVVIQSLQDRIEELEAQNQALTAHSASGLV